MRWLIAFSLLVVALPFAGPAMARDSLGMFGAWGAFRDPQVPRCYALAKAVPSTLQRDYPPYADVAWWPRQGVRGQVHFRLSRKLAANAPMLRAWPAISSGGARLTATRAGCASPVGPAAGAA